MQKVISITKIIIVISMFSIYSIFAFVYNLLISKNKTDYIKNILISLDQTGAAIIDGTEDWTISSNSYKKCIEDGKCIRKEIINWAFGENHCRRTFLNEIREFNKRYFENVR